MSSKEIANALNVTTNSVDQSLKRAKNKLGTTSRRAAARIFALFDDEHVDQNLVDQFMAIERDRSHDPISSTGVSNVSGHGVGDENHDLATAHPSFFVDGLIRRPDAQNGPLHRDTSANRLVRMIIVTILSAITFSAILSGLLALENLFTP